MSTQNFNLRGIPKEVVIKLKKEAAKINQSVNTFILKGIEKQLGLTRTGSRPRFHDLDYLAGTWSSEDVKKFEKETQQFRKVDKEIWS